MINKIEKILDEEIRPYLKTHGGNVELIDVDNGQVFVKLIGGCQGCVMSQYTLVNSITKAINAHFPELKIIDLTNHKEGTNPYFK